MRTKLVLRLHPEESILIGENILIYISEYQGMGKKPRSTRLTFEAPRDTMINRIDKNGVIKKKGDRDNEST